MNHCRILTAGLLAVTSLAACKTTHGSNEDAFTVGGDVAAAHQLIMQSVVKTYPFVSGSTAVIDQFATALQNGQTAQAAKSDYVLQQAYAKLNSGNPDQATEFDGYVAIEFVVLTNLTTVIAAPGTALQYTGSANN